MNFQTKTLEKPQRTCLRLKELREKKGISLEDIAEKLKMSKSHILALEDCRAHELPFASVYKKKLVKQYCQIVDADYKAMVHQFVEEEIKEQKTHEPQNLSKRKSYRWNNLPSFIRIGAVFCMALVFFGYLGLQVKKIVDPPRLDLFSPMNGFITEESNLQIKGQTDKEVKISVNGKEIKNSEQGIFAETLTLSPGVNTIVVSAEKKHGKTTTETRYVVLQNSPTFTLSETQKHRN